MPRTDSTAILATVLGLLLAGGPRAAAIDAENRPIAAIEITGLEQVSEQLVRNSVRSQPGEPYRQQTVDDDVTRITHLGRFTRVTPRVSQAADGSAKLDVLLENLEEAVSEGHKALVFSQWTSFLDLVEPRLTASELAFGRLDGSTRDRAGVVARFQDEAGPPVLLISLRAGGTGVNLTAADHVFILDPWWNPAVEDQAADRAHRIGQDRTVIVHRLVAAETVEERILALQARKRELSEAALGQAEVARSITREELLALLD